MHDPSTSASVQLVELAEIPVSALLFGLLSTRFTGVVTVPQGPPFAGSRTIHVRGGMPVLTDWQQQGSRLGELALARGIVSATALARAVKTSVETGRRLGETLRELGEIDVTRMLQLVRMQTMRRLTDVFSLVEGRVTLSTSDSVDDELLQINVLELVHRGVTARYDLERIGREMGAAFAAPLRATAALSRYVEQFKFRADDRSVLAALGTGAPTTIAELTRISGTVPQRCAQIVHVLWTCRMVESVESLTTAEPLAAGHGAAVDASLDTERFTTALEQLERRVRQGTEPAAILELERDADSEAIDRAWRVLAESVDPERMPAGADEAVRARATAVLAALESVRDAARRRRHALAEISGLRMVRDGKFARGLAMLHEAQTLGPVGPEVEAAVCWATLQSGSLTDSDLRLADRRFAGLIAAHPDLVETHYYQACVASTLGRTSDAIAGFQRVLEADPDHLDAQRQLRALRRDERPTAAKKPEPARRPEFLPLVPNTPRHPLLSPRMRALYWLAGVVLLVLVVANIVLRLDLDF